MRPAAPSAPTTALPQSFENYPGLRDDRLGVGAAAAGHQPLRVLGQRDGQLERHRDLSKSALGGLECRLHAVGVAAARGQVRGDPHAVGSKERRDLTGRGRGHDPQDLLDLGLVVELQGHVHRHDQRAFDRLIREPKPFEVGDDEFRVGQRLGGFALDAEQLGPRRKEETPELIVIHETYSPRLSCPSERPAAGVQQHQVDESGPSPLERTQFLGALDLLGHRQRSIPIADAHQRSDGSGQHGDLDSAVTHLPRELEVLVGKRHRIREPIRRLQQEAEVVVGAARRIAEAVLERHVQRATQQRLGLVVPATSHERQALAVERVRVDVGVLEVLGKRQGLLERRLGFLEPAPDREKAAELARHHREVAIGLLPGEHGVGSRDPVDRLVEVVARELDFGEARMDPRRRMRLSRLVEQQDRLLEARGRVLGPAPDPRHLAGPFGELCLLQRRVGQLGRLQNGASSRRRQDAARSAARVSIRLARSRIFSSVGCVRASRTLHQVTLRPRRSLPRRRPMPAPDRRPLADAWSLRRA